MASHSFARQMVRIAREIDLIHSPMNVFRAARIPRSVFAKPIPATTATPAPAKVPSQLPPFPTR
ncbi:hypothetical protein SAMN05443244_0670 [Terriglobus roseus]|uniref:Uncharacterized protein n=1 Tax=Terriglobus roseus TaxID=392734 RepID=A0A1H4JK68_9BACT|nr:hypothetical protein SAMN05443244_0670 [Terriglobus roseus]